MLAAASCSPVAHKLEWQDWHEMRDLVNYVWKHYIPSEHRDKFVRTIRAMEKQKLIKI